MLNQFGQRPAKLRETTRTERQSQRARSERDALTDRTAPNGHKQCLTPAVVGAGQAGFHGPFATGHGKIRIAARLAALDSPIGLARSVPRSLEGVCWHRALPIPCFLAAGVTSLVPPAPVGSRNSRCSPLLRKATTAGKNCKGGKGKVGLQTAFASGMVGVLLISLLL